MSSNAIAMRRAIAVFPGVIMPVVAQSGGGFDLTWSTLDGGGATSAGGGVTGEYDQRIYAFPDVFADFDDGDKDLFDVADFQNCFGLSGAELEPACARADWDEDGEIGAREIRELSARINGPQ